MTEYFGFQVPTKIAITNNMTKISQKMILSASSGFKTLDVWA
jgi:hypothetical protein